MKVVKCIDRLLLASVLCLCIATSAFGVEIHSNGLGGGRWCDPASWHGGAVPAGTDVVVVATGDTIVFDGHSPDGPTCAGLFLDPESVLSLASNGAEHVLGVAGPVESYGIIRLDGSRRREGRLELRLLAPAPSCTIRLLRRGGLLAYGAEGLPDGQFNVVISTAAVAEGQTEPVGIIVAGRDSMVDLQRVHLSGVSMQTSSIDNTGFKASERLNVLGCLFTQQARLILHGCDTVAVRNNRFEYQAETPLGVAAIELNGCKLTDLTGNVVSGYRSGLFLQNDVDSSATGNVVSDGVMGIYWHGQNAMLRGNRIARCTTGVHITSSSGVIEKTNVSTSQNAVEVVNSTVQLTDLHVAELAEDGTALSLTNSTVTLLNSNVQETQVKVAGTPPGNEPWVQAIEYLIVRLKGEWPDGTEVIVGTAQASGGPPPGMADLNVRNSPAPLSTSGFTPLPSSLRPLVVRSWSLRRDGQVAPAPFYDLLVQAPAAEAGGPPRVLKRVVLEPKPEWYREEPDAPVPTVEVSVP